MIKALSKEFKGKLVFGEIRSDQQELLKQLNVTTLPTLRVITDNGQDY